MGAVDKIFDHFETLCDGYTDMPGTQEARNGIFRYMEEQKMDVAQVEPYLSALISEYERQGFLYGFRYAAALFLDGALQYGCSKRGNACMRCIEEWERDVSGWAVQN